MSRGPTGPSRVQGSALAVGDLRPQTEKTPHAPFENPTDSRNSSRNRKGKDKGTTNEQPQRKGRPYPSSFADSICEGIHLPQHGEGKALSVQMCVRWAAGCRPYEVMQNTPGRHTVRRGFYMSQLSSNSLSTALNRLSRIFGNCFLLSRMNCFTSSRRVLPSEGQGFFTTGRSYLRVKPITSRSST